MFVWVSVGVCVLRKCVCVKGAISFVFVSVCMHSVFARLSIFDLIVTSRLLFLTSESSF